MSCTSTSEIPLRVLPSSTPAYFLALWLMGSYPGTLDQHALTVSRDINGVHRVGHGFVFMAMRGTSRCWVHRSTCRVFVSCRPLCLGSPREIVDRYVGFSILRCCSRFVVRAAALFVRVDVAVCSLGKLPNASWVHHLEFIASLCKGW